MRQFLLLSLCLFLGSMNVCAEGLDNIRQALEQSGSRQLQEKVFLHTDNTCYFVGDTLWFKGYVVRADNLQPTNMSRILYVELLTPDGMLVERQNIIISPNGHTCGQFVLEDSLYSGYYELRAYTRWMLNFNVSHERYSTHDTWHFYNKQMAADYFRTWDGLYSRVLPIYGKPEKEGDYDVRTMYQRPKTRLPRKVKEELKVTFYPEGGHLVQGVENRVAFEATTELGEAVDIEGKVMSDGQQVATLQTSHMGRGSFKVVPTGKSMKAHFVWKGKNYDFSLPKADQEGIAIQLDDQQLTIHASKLSNDCEYGLSVLCRGQLSFFSSLTSITSMTSTTSSTTFSIPFDSLSTGVNDLTIFDSNGQILADRLFFVNHHEQEANIITAPISSTKTYQPYEQIELPVQCEGVTQPTTFSISIRDTNTDEPSYNDGDIMTDLLLSSELRGFIARPAYYFESDDAQHRQHLDLLMMVQGWRKYKWNELSDTTRQMRYEPEHTMTIEGAVYKMLSIVPVGEWMDPETGDSPGLNEITYWQYGSLHERSNSQEENTSDSESQEETQDVVEVDQTTSTTTLVGISSGNDQLGVNHGNLRYEVLLEAEMVIDDQIAGIIQKTENGRFKFNVPPFYGNCYLNMKAYKESDSIKKCMGSRQDPTFTNEDAFPDFYVKRDLVYPMFTHEYNFYERHQPDVTEEELIDTLSEFSMENDIIQLGNVNVKGRRRGKRAIDWKKPAFVIDAYDLYNDMTDRGLSFGKLDMRQFPVQVARYLYGNMNRHRSYNVDGRLDGLIYYRNYAPFETRGVSAAESESVQSIKDRIMNNRTPQSIYNNLKLKRLDEIRVFSDYEPRYRDSLMVEERYAADATVELGLIPDDGRQPTFRDRHILFRGFNMPERFYQPDYSVQQPAEPTDYRRTLYWNPNAVTDSEGRFTVTFYNNSKQTRIKMSAAGVTKDGQLLHGK